VAAQASRVGCRDAGAASDTPRCAWASSLPEVVTVESLAAFLGLNRKTIYAAIDRGEVPGARRVGRAIRILRDAVLVWLAQGAPLGPGTVDDTPTEQRNTRRTP
jgi:excisionase family DNA binding protein